MQILLKEHELDDNQNQRVSLELTQIGTQQALTMAKSHSSKPISSYSQCVPAFAIYAAVMTERFPNLAPSLFKHISKHISDIADMDRRFRGMAWRLYDESFRREKKAHQLEFCQIHWYLRFRCLERPTQAGRPPFLNRTPAVHSSGVFPPGLGNTPLVNAYQAQSSHRPATRSQRQSDGTWSPLTCSIMMNRNQPSFSMGSQRGSL